ncbi:Competence protein F homolog, phosphoribosyltransferase domain; protein YhgH required for utilization of DNA as sole source of carbon and energy [hydrothermal vent metagenome]|uniref:Competence protein F homolog, phosphoribosyltransferase domain protein YhgH required for utilization of DNA as sole source of carbon and energy n=1 Tax=hydrothermal vent metagenome TaxID=652676 RepID=A0A3B0TAJ1_9ZZZZ
MEARDVTGLDRLIGLTKLGRSRLVDFLLPPRCAACNTQTAVTGAVCVTCWLAIDFIEWPLCPRLGLPFPYSVNPDAPSGEALCAEAIARPPVFARARAVAVHDGPARRLVSALKFRDRTDHAPLMAQWMARAGAELLADADLMAPIPLHRRRLWQRKHNQAALLVNAIARITGKAALPDLLRRTRSTRAQIGLNARQRAANVRGAFAVEPRYLRRIEGARVLLVDDVYTTGATVTAAARALLRGGAAAVDVLAFARVVGPAQIPL